MASNVKNPVDITRLPVNNEECTFEGWTIKYQKSHILSSKCTNNNSCSEESSEECLFCRCVIFLNMLNKFILNDYRTINTLLYSETVTLKYIFSDHKFGFFSQLKKVIVLLRPHTSQKLLTN